MTPFYMIPGIKLGTHVPATASDEDLLFLRQLGIRHVRVHFAVDQDDPAFVRAVCDRIRAVGMDIFSTVTMLYQAPEIAFALSGRDAVLERFRAFIRTMGENRLHTLDYDFFLYAPLPATGETLTRECPTRAFDLREALAKPPVVERLYDADEMWANYDALMQAILPTAEKAGVRLALHPDDPPTPSLLGVARIFHSMDGLVRAMERYDSPSWGILLCVGTWAEGGDAMGASVTDAIRFFADRGKLFTAHLRNVTGPLPCFAETFMDNGCVDMAEVMKTLKDVGFSGLIIPDHFPCLAGDTLNRASLAYAIAYLRALSA